MLYKHLNRNKIYAFKRLETPEELWKLPIIYHKRAQTQK